jgi:hypothetical protein
MKRVVIAGAVIAAVAPVVAPMAFATTTPGGSWSFTDYTADPGSWAADSAFHVATGAHISSYCHGSRVPSAPQDVNTYELKVARASQLHLSLSSTGVWGVDIDTARGTALVGTAATQPSTPATLTTVVQPGTYVINACNLGGAPTASVDYQLTRVRG